MANPQLENGYTSIANDILEHLCRTRINGEARQILDFIIRKTYGYKKKFDFISLSQFVEFTGLKKNTICRGINKLRAMNLLFITQKENAVANLYEFNKNFDEWKPLPKKGTLPKKRIVVTQKGNNHSPKRDIQKKKANITKERRRVTDQDRRLAELFVEQIKQNIPQFKEPNIEQWAGELNKIVRIDGRTYEQVEWLIKWAQKDSFWQANILSPAKLRKQFDRLVIEVKRVAAKKSSGLNIGSIT